VRTVNKINTKKLRSYQAEILADQENVKKLCAKDAMINPVLLYSEDSSEKTLKKLKKENINSCIVVTSEKKVVGEINNNDIIRLFLNQVKYEPLVQMLNRGYSRELIYRSEKDLINKHKSTVNLNTPINQIIKFIFKEGVPLHPCTGWGEKSNWSNYSQQSYQLTKGLLK
jgi:predicted transcriptional regulator